MPGIRRRGRRHFRFPLLDRPVSETRRTTERPTADGRDNNTRYDYATTVTEKKKNDERAVGIFVRSSDNTVHTRTLPSRNDGANSGRGEGRIIISNVHRAKTRPTRTIVRINGSNGNGRKYKDTVVVIPRRCLSYVVRARLLFPI